MSAESFSLAETLRRAARDVPAYRGLTGANLSEFPVVTKFDFRSRYADFLSQALSAQQRKTILDAVEQLLGGPKIPDHERRAGEFILERSSGTTGPYLWYPRSREERIRLSCELARVRAQFDPAYSPRRFCDLNLPFLHAHRRDAQQDPRAFTASIYEREKAKGTTYLYGHLNLLTSTSALLKPAQGGFAFSTVEVTGDYLTPEKARSLTTILGGRIVNQYGCRESWVIGYDAALTGRFRLLPQTHVELIDVHRRPVEAEGEWGSVVVTSAMAHIFPAIRFVTGDIGCWETVDGTRHLRLNDERQQSALRLPNGQAISGVKLMKAIIGGACSANGQRVVQPWRVRKRGAIYHVQLNPADWDCREAIAQALGASALRLAPSQLEFAIWPGWALAEKQILFVEETSSPT